MKVIGVDEKKRPAYQKLLEWQATTQNIRLAQLAAYGDDGPPPRCRIWKSTKHKDISRSIRFFLWMLIHGGYKVGKYWDNIPNLQRRGQCSTCGTHETMEHILAECNVPGQKQIRDLASKLWRLKTGEELRPSVAQIMAWGATKKKDPGTTRLYRILVSESAHLIWRLQNERVINE
ncbi:hypothetical protein B0H19DRAFT_1059752 [Mycena capillaripes]|nr:hypothetical protein B0H19DRAFT_1059752 [Mycena capillaripes]